MIDGDGMGLPIRIPLVRVALMGMDKYTLRPKSSAGHLTVFHSY